MVDSILTNQAPIVVRTAENKSMTTAAVANASSIPEAEVEEEIIDVTPRLWIVIGLIIFISWRTRVETAITKFYF